jgi:hypothetical protein
MSSKTRNGKSIQHAPVTSLARMRPQAKRAAAIAGGATLGVAALTATAITLNDRLQRFARDMAIEAAALPPSLLTVLGLQKRRSSFWTFGPALGTLAVGLAAGGVTAIWLARRNEESVGSSDEDDMNSLSETCNSAIPAGEARPHA